MPFLTEGVSNDGYEGVRVMGDEHEPSLAIYKEGGRETSGRKLSYMLAHLLFPLELSSTYDKVSQT